MCGIPSTGEVGTRFLLASILCLPHDHGRPRKQIGLPSGERRLIRGPKEDGHVKKRYFKNGEVILPVEEK